MFEQTSVLITISSWITRRKSDARSFGRPSEGQHAAVRWDRSPIDFAAPCCLLSRRKNGERDARLSRGSIAPAFANCVGDSVSSKNLCADFLGLTLHSDEILQLCVQRITRLLLPRAIM